MQDLERVYGKFGFPHLQLVLPDQAGEPVEIAVGKDNLLLVEQKLGELQLSYETVALAP